MTVQDLRNIQTNYALSIAEKHLLALRRQRVGYPLPAVYSQRSDIIEEIVLSAVVLANKPLYNTEQIRVPAWADQTTLNKFISKITNYGTDNF